MCVSQWTDVDDPYVVKRVSAQGCAFGGRLNTAPYFGGQIPDIASNIAGFVLNGDVKVQLHKKKHFMACIFLAVFLRQC